jgi:alkylation response protein AidB-like acyl-CoA dehydrogenase
MSRVPLDRSSSVEEVRAVVGDWVVAHVPEPWRDAGERGGRDAIRRVRPRADYEVWYPTFADSGLAVPTWPVEYCGLDLAIEQARAVNDVLAPYNLGRLNPLGINSVAPPLFAYGTEEQRRRFLPPLVRNEEKWCQLLSEPGAGSDLASLATRAQRDGEEWVISGQKVWTTWAHVSDFAICLVRTDPDVPKRKGLTYFVVDLHAPGVDVRPLRHIGGEVDFNEVYLDEVRVPDFYRIGGVGDGWRVANATLTGERKMVSGGGQGGFDRIGGSGMDAIIRRAVDLGRTTDPHLRQRITALYSEEQIRRWTNQRVADGGGKAGPAVASIGKIHNGAMNQRIQLLATDLLGVGAVAWESGSGADPEGWAEGLPYEVRGMLRSRANTIEGGTTEVNKNILGETVLGLPREPDPYRETPWKDVPRS